MRLTILGASPVRPNPGEACSGYLVQSAKAKVLVDCGSGVLAELLRHLHLPELDAVVITHAHPDHCLDLVSLRQSLAFVQAERRAAPLEVYALQAAIDTLRRLGQVFGAEGEAFWEPYIRLNPVDPDRMLLLGDLGISFCPTRHYIPCLAVRIALGAKSLVLGADGGPDPAIVEFARDADLLLLEATLRAADMAAGVQEPGHLSGQEAGQLAQAAGARRLLLIHYFSEYGPEVLAEATLACQAPVALAVQGAQHEV